MNDMVNLPIKNLDKFKVGPTPSRNVEVFGYTKFIVPYTNHFHRIDALTEGIVIIWEGNVFGLTKGWSYNREK